MHTHALFKLLIGVVGLIAFMLVGCTTLPSNPPIHASPAPIRPTPSVGQATTSPNITAGATSKLAPSVCGYMWASQPIPPAELQKLQEALVQAQIVASIDASIQGEAQCGRFLGMNASYHFIVQVSNLRATAQLAQHAALLRQLAPQLGQPMPAQIVIVFQSGNRQCRWDAKAQQCDAVS